MKDTIDLASLRGRRLAVDGNGELYQFLALIRQRDGTPLHDATGRITSHLSGLFYRTTHLVARHAIQLVFVFDGRPPALKSAELDRRPRSGSATTRNWQRPGPRATFRARTPRPP